MKLVSNMLNKIEKKSKHDLIKVVLGACAGFIVERIVTNAYDSAFELKNNNTTVIDS